MKFFYFTVFILLWAFCLPAKSDKKFELGKEVFLNNCASCHVLEDAESVSNIGPNLNKIRPQMERVINAVTMGIGVMPAFEDILSTQKIKNVSYYVFQSTKK
jgi:cytochrome c6